MSIELTLAIGFSAAVILWMGIPLLRRRVGPNSLYGFRVPATLRDEGLWYDVNAKVGLDCVGMGLGLFILLGVGLAGVTDERTIGLACAAWFLLGCCWSAAHGFYIVRTRRKHG